MLKKYLLITLLLFCSILSFSQIKGGKIIVRPKGSNYTLTINSNVKPYTVFIDGRQIKGNRVTLSAGNHNVMVKSNGYTNYNTTVNLNRNIVLNAALNPMTVNYTLTVNSNIRPYTVFVDGRQVKGNKVVLSSGAHSVIVKSNGYSNYNTTVNLNRNIVLNASLIPNTAFVSVYLPSTILNNSINGAINQIRIFDNGRLLNGFNFELTPGDHTIRIESGGLVIEGYYNFLPGNTYKIEPVMYLNFE